MDHEYNQIYTYIQTYINKETYKQVNGFIPFILFKQYNYCFLMYTYTNL